MRSLLLLVVRLALAKDCLSLNILILSCFLLAFKQAQSCSSVSLASYKVRRSVKQAPVEHGRGVCWVGAAKSRIHFAAEENRTGHQQLALSVTSDLRCQKQRERSLRKQAFAKGTRPSEPSLYAKVTWTYGEWRKAII